MKPFTCMIRNIMVNDGTPQKNIYFNKTERRKNKPLGFMIKNKDLFTILIGLIKKNKNINKFDNRVSTFFRDQENVAIKLNTGKQYLPTIDCCRWKKFSHKKKVGINSYKKNYKQKAFIFNVKHKKA